MKGSGSADNHRNSGSPCKRPRTQRRSCHHVEPTVIISSHLIPPSSTCSLSGGRIQPWMCCSKAAPTIIGRFSGCRELSEPWTGFTLFTRLNEKTSRRRQMVLGVAADKNSSNIKAQPLARNLVRNVQSISTKRKNIIGRLKNRRSTMLGS